MKIACIVLNYNGGEEVLTCLGSLAPFVKKYNFEILLVDNNSSDGSVRKIRKRFPTTEIICNKKNLGYAGGNNIGIKAALSNGSDLVVLLNQDVEVKKDFLEKILYKIKKDDKLGIAGSLITFYKGKTKYYDLGGAIDWFWARAVHCNLKKRPGWEKKEVDYVAGCCMLVKKEVFERVGLLDEDYFFGWEDVDFCLKAKKAGFETVIFNSGEVFHKGSTSIGYLSSGWVYYCLRSRLLFIKKHLGIKGLILRLGAPVISVLAWSLVFYLKRPERLKAIWASYSDFLKGMKGRGKNDF